MKIFTETFHHWNFISYSQDLLSSSLLKDAPLTQKLIFVHIDEEIALNGILYNREMNFELLACETFWKQYLHILNKCYKAFLFTEFPVY